MRGRNGLPSAPRIAVVTALSILASIGADALLVKLAVSSAPSLRNYSHFRLDDYGLLSLVGIAAAGAAWWLVVRFVTTPRPVFFRLAVVATLALWTPDVWLLIRHEPAGGVLTLAAMHLAIALITYNLLVRAAPVRPRLGRGSVSEERSSPRGATAGSLVTTGEAEGPRLSRHLWQILLFAVVAEFLTGVVGVVYVPFHRPNGWLVHQGRALYVGHAIIGAVLGIGAVAALAAVRRRRSANRFERIAGVTGLVGVVLGAVGGLLCYDQALRLFGMAVMFVGVSVAFFGYLIPLLGSKPLAPPEWRESTGQHS